jgi:hypothetical protein
MAQEYSSAHIHGAVQPRYGEVHIRNRGRLPHWEKEEGLYFLTFHLADSLPHSACENRRMPPHPNNCQTTECQFASRAERIARQL